MAAAVMRYGDKMPLDGSGSAGWQGVSGIGLLEGDCFATLIHGRLFPVHFSPADWESRVESWMPNEAWKATTRTSGRFSAWEVAQSEVQTGDRMLFNNKILIASKVRGGGRKVSQPQIAAGKEKNFNAINEISADQGI